MKAGFNSKKIKSSVLKKALLVWFLTLLMAILASINTQRTYTFWGLNDLSSAVEVRDKALPSDIGNYIQYSDHIINTGGFKTWHSACWPPGLPLMIVALRVLTGDSAYPLKMVSISILLWTTVLSMFILFSSWPKSLPLRFLVINLFWLLPEMRNMSVGVGSIMSESTATGLFIAGMIMFFLGRKENIFLRRFLAVVALVTAVYIRAYFDPVILIFLLALFAFDIFNGIYNSFWADVFSKKSDYPKINLVPSIFKALKIGLLAAPKSVNVRRSLILFLVFFALTVPWRLSLKHLHGKFGMVLGAGQWKLQWSQPDQFASFQHAANSACVVQPEVCQILRDSNTKLSPSAYRALALGTLAARPMSWIKHRLKNFNWLWLGIPWENNDVRATISKVEGLFYLLMGLWGLYLTYFGWLWPLPKSKISTSFGVGVLAFFVANFLIFLIVQFEARYSIALRLFCLALPFLAMSQRKSKMIEE